MKLRHNAWALLFIFIVYTVITLVEIGITVNVGAEDVCTPIRESFLGCYRKIKEELIMRKLMDWIFAISAFLMMMAVNLCLFGIDVPTSIMVIELIVMIISQTIDRLQTKIEKERRRKLKIAKQMREMIL